MLGWEFPPHISGGLGTACFGLTKGLDEIGVQVCFVLPTAVPLDAASHVELRSPADVKAGRRPSDRSIEEIFEHVQLRRVPAALQAYASPAADEQTIQQLIAMQAAAREGPEQAEEPAEPRPGAEAATARADAPSGSFVAGPGRRYAGDLMGQVQRYARLALELAEDEEFDVVHAHDWMTYPAGIAAAKAVHRPLVVHVHSTEFDRAGENVNQQVYDIERMGMHAADCVVCVSHLTQNIVITRYGVPGDKVEVVYNAVDIPEREDWQMPPIRRDEKIVLFLGRITMQKGPEYFLRAAKKVVEKYPKVRFVVAGSGDMITQCIREVADLKLGRHVTFTGFLRGDDVSRVFRMADLYVMPSVSEPFGIAPLEAISHDVPVIISKQSGVSEVLKHVLKVDFWDIDEMANKILAVLRLPRLHEALRRHGQIELRKLSWRDSAKKLSDIYARLTRAAG